MEQLKILVKPNSKKNEIIFDKEKNLYKINIKAKPEHNKANIELIKFLKKYFKKEVEIIRGLKSRNKVIRLS